MAFYDKESDIFQLMQSVPYEKIACLTESDSEEKLVEAIRNSTHCETLGPGPGKKVQKERIRWRTS